MKLFNKHFNSCQSVCNARFSDTGDNFYPNRYNIRTSLPNSGPDYKSLFKNYYKSKKGQNYTNLSSGVNNHYLKFQDDVKNYISNDNNRLGLKLEGNKQLENYPINRFKNVFNKVCSARERILQHQILNYFYPTDNNNKLMGEQMKLTPIPCKRNSFLRNKKEKDDYTKAKRAAVCMRRLEYTHGLKKNKSQEFLRNTENEDNKIDLLSIIKGAVLIIEDWWKKILEERKDFPQNEINDEYFKEFTGRGSTRTMHDNILEGFNSDRYYNNYRNENNFIEDWLIRQSMRLIQKKEQKSYRFNSYNYNLLTPKSKTNKKEKSNNKNKNKKSYKKPKNRSVISSPINKNHICSNRKPKKNYNIIYNKNSEQNPIKVIQSSVILPFESQNNLKSIATTATASNYLQNSFKDYCLYGSNKFRPNSCSNKKLKSFELIESKYQSIKYRNNQFPFTSRTDFLQKTQDKFSISKSTDKIRACLNNENKETKLNLENNETISNNGNYGINLYSGNNGAILNVGNKETKLNNENCRNENNIIINTNTNINQNENMNSISNEGNEKIKYESITINNQSELFNNLNDEDITNEKNDDEINDKKNRDNSTNMVTINNGNIDISEIIEDENKKHRILRAKNQKKNNIKENENFEIKKENDYNNNIKNNIINNTNSNINDNIIKNDINDINVNINNSLNQNISENSINRNLIEDLNKETSKNNIHKSIKINNNDDNNKAINNYDFYANDNQNDLNNINNQDISSDIEPINPDNLNNIYDVDADGDGDNEVYDDGDENGEEDINTNLNINKIIKRKYQIKYNITKSQNSPKRKNSMSSKSSMDGSVDEIITKKLIEIHNRNQKYAERINKAYNQVKSSKEFNLQKGKFLNDIKMNNSGSIHNIEETEY